MKTSVIVVIVVGVAILAVIVGGAAGYFIARTQFSASNIAWKVALSDGGQGLYGPGMMYGNWQGKTGPGTMYRNLRGRMGAGMMNGLVDDEDRPRLQYMLDAYAEALDMTPDDLKKELNSGKSIWDLASAKGIKAEEFDQFMIDAGTQALNKMVVDGEITQKQADAMIERMQENWQDVDPETCPCFEQFGGRSRMWRWNTP